MKLRCKRCATAVQSSEVKYISSSEFVCNQCFLADRGRTREAPKEKRTFDAAPVRKVTLVCEKCSFPNKVSEDKIQGRICSYCGGSSFAEKQSSAAAILQEVDDE